MLRLFKHYISLITVLAFLVDLFLLGWSAYMGYYLRFYSPGRHSVEMAFGFGNALMFAVVGLFSFFLIDLYQFEGLQGFSLLLKRLFTAFILFFVGLTSIYYLVPSM